MYENTVNNGILQLMDPGTSHVYQIEVKDFKGNTSTIVANIKNDPAPDSLTVSRPEQPHLC